MSDNLFVKVSDLVQELEYLVYQRYMEVSKERKSVEIVGTEEDRLAIVDKYNQLMKVKKQFKKFVYDVTVLDKDKFHQSYVSSVHLLNNSYKSLVHLIRCYCLDEEE
jgi:hypothetical protein